ncbi:hypothetical protein JRQ81_019039 [Phrynocephalus forsythii]|uniref:Zinc finger protein 282-like n=1 Tax=Phrynocephalus forsythii TaxID=171643 RepID=A0A9Q0XS39_9SAUR|nr:hypothetical protein JRQ81_019039 [Phrynocephalus forsythii]
MPVTFVDIAVYFSAEEWESLAEWQKDLYNNLVKENYESLLTLGANVNASKPDSQSRVERRPDPCVPEHPATKQQGMGPADPCTEPLMSAPDILTRIKQEQPFVGGGQYPDERGIPADPCAGAEALISAHDFLSWIKQEEEPCVRERWEPAERDILTGPSAAGDGMVVKAEDPRPCPAEAGRPREPMFQGEPPPLTPAAVAAGAMEGYLGPCGPVPPLAPPPPPLSPARSRAGKPLELESELQGVLGPQTPGERRHGCNECGKMFGVKKSLKVHQRSHHGQERPYECSECCKSFNCHSGLVRHQMTHRGERPYKCEECGKCYSRKEHLQNHQRLHTGERPFQCPVCGKRFIRKQNLLKHQRIHTGERPYQCAECGRSFRYKESLKDHLRTHSTESAAQRLQPSLAGDALS